MSEGRENYLRGLDGARDARAIDRGEMPVNANLETVDPDCEHLAIVRDAPRRGPIRGALSNSFGFGGSNSCVVFRHPEETDALVGARG